ncbi:MAG: bifunctional phosphoglucose/phosphomannose isomerase [Pelotomaculum sp. PtaB.Bin013]|nr:MAG: bifunctional phosphoglucose/phosphomannose isomerase [Pelotomaculum sp. PtaB.Bin013]
MSLHVDLNQEDELRRIDTTGMFAALEGLPDQCAKACWELVEKVQFPEIKAISNVVVTGLGGSAIGGDLLRVYAAGRISVPIIVNRDYVLPKFVGSDTLVFAVSYSGNTEETLSAYAEARDRGASVVAITTGGKLGEAAKKDGFPVVEIPGGISPRAATGFLFIPTLKILNRLGLLSDVTEEINEMINLIGEMREKLGPAVAETENLAKQIARRIHEKIPVIWGSAGTTEVVAQRWKGQINENAKSPAYWNVLPELNHNEIVGLEFPAEILKKIHIIILRDERDHPRVQKRIEITKEVIQKTVGGYTEVWASGNGVLARLYSLICTGDFTSVYLAALNGVDPGPVKVIDFLKRELQNR